MENRLQEINGEFWEWQDELAVRLLSLRPYSRIEKDIDKLDKMIEMIGIKEKKLRRK